jgi:hypothetical protein
MNAAQNTYESQRMVLRERPGDQVVAQLAAAADWTLLADNAGETSSQYTREQNWGVRRGLHVHLICDALSEYAALTVLAEDSAAGEEFERLLKGHLNPFTREELLEPIAEVLDPSERMLRLMRLALGAPSLFDRDVYARLEQAAEDADPRVRDAATLAAGYVAWPQLRALLRRLAEHDPHPMVRQDATNWLGMYDDGGVPEE